MNESSIKDNVHMRNEVLKYLSTLSKKLTPPLTPFIGKKLIKSDNTLVARAQDLIAWPQKIKVKPLPHGRVEISRPWSRAYSFSLVLHVRIAFITDKAACPSVYYASESICIADLADHKLVKILPYTFVRTSPAQELQNFKRAVKLRQKLTDATNRLVVQSHREYVRRS